MDRHLPVMLHPAYDILVRSYRLVACRPWPLHGRDRFRPVFIVGSGRSGNTLLRRILQAGSDLHIPPETFVLGRAIRLFLRNRHMPWNYLVRLVMGLFEFHKEFDKFEVVLRPLVQELAEAPQESRNLASMLNAFYQYHGRETEQTFVRWGDKTPYNTFSLDLILRVFPDAQFVHMLRDGADVVQSFVEAGLQADLEAAAKRWVESVRRVRAFSRRLRPQCFEVRYESLVTRPADVTRELCAFLDISFDQVMISKLEHVRQMGDVKRYDHLANVAQPITAEGVGRGRSALTRAQRAALKAVLEPELVSWGYEPLG